MIRRRSLAAVFGASLVPLGARGADFLAKPITLVVPFAAGGAIG
jgi:hypothetical protein